MRKYQQKQLLELVKTLNEANAEIERLFSRGDLDAVLQLLSDCQNFAVQMGEYIESIEGEGTQTVTLLEEYHDDLYNVSVEIGEGTAKPNAAKHLRKKIISIETSIKTELKPNRIEVVFLPYKASMWDSLESVWLAAKDDPQCDAYVVPIPYYEKVNVTGLGKMYYEGDQYPNYVPITDWREYDIEERQPDVVFIHYAYDDMTQNYSVHPNFFSKNMKPFCEQLIYIPYYVQPGATVAEYNGYLPGIVNADYVIVQSEEVRQGYIEQYSKYYKQYKHIEQLKKPEDKFIALGSPKSEKVLNSKKEDYKLPEDWKRLIYKPDGTAKKIVLYNTHMFRWIDGGEQYFEKVRSVFKTFQKREDVVLWWRPHPSTEQNFRTLRPKLLNEYYRTIQEYKSDNFGIYDETPDLHRAITCTDAYYGDDSSLVAMYQCTGKPVMIQNANITPGKNCLASLEFEDLFDDGENYWFTAYSFNALFKMNKITWIAEYIGCFPNENPNGFRLYGGITQCNEKIFFSPLSAKEIAVYNKIDNTFSKIPIDTPEEYPMSIYNHEKKFFSTICYKNYVFIIPFTYPAIIRFDTITDEITYFTNWVKPLNDLILDTKQVYFKQYHTISSLLILPCGISSAIVIFNMDTCSANILGLNKKGFSSLGICYDGNDYWLPSLKSDSILRWNLKTESQKEYINLPNGLIDSVWYCTFSDGFVWILPSKSNMALKINITNGNISLAKEIQTNNECGKDNMSFTNANFFIKKIGESIFTFMGQSNSLIEFNCETKQRREESIILAEESNNELNEYFTNNFYKDTSLCFDVKHCNFYENAFLRKLNCFLYYIAYEYESDKATELRNLQIELSKKLVANPEGQAGSNIYEHCKRLMIS